MVDLSKTIKINKTHEISYGMLLLTGIVTLFEMLGMMAMNNWIFPPSAFFLIANAFLTIRKQSTDNIRIIELTERVKKLEERK